MKRIIKFRGKSKRTGEWLYGDLVRSVEGTFAIVPPFEMTTDKLCDKYEVDEKTIGQLAFAYEGVRGGKADIYTGDILYIIPQWTGNKPQYCVVDEYGLVTMENNCYFIHKICFHVCQLEHSSYKWEIAGNVHDNPILLKLVKKQ